MGSSQQMSSLICPTGQEIEIQRPCGCAVLEVLGMQAVRPPLDSRSGHTFYFLPAFEFTTLQLCWSFHKLSNIL